MFDKWGLRTTYSTNSDDSPSIGQTWSIPPNQKDWMIQHVVPANLHDRKNLREKCPFFGCFWYIYINKCVGGVMDLEILNNKGLDQSGERTPKVVSW